VTDVEDRLAVLEARLRRLEDEEQIRQLICRWGPACDTGLADEATAIWSDDAVLISDMSRLEGPGDVTAMIESEGQQSLIRQGCAHVQGVPLIRLDGDVASAVNYSQVFLHTDPGYEVWRVSANQWKFRRSGDGWLVTSREAMVIDGGPAAKDILVRAYR
jgi:ketosteroid isomerase-like protein